VIVFDSGAIYMAISQGKSDQLKGQYTLPLAMFELGNIFWKYSVFSKVYSHNEVIEFMGSCQTVLEKMKIVYPDMKMSYQIATDLHLSFYDASYVALAKSLNISLITMDNKLANKARACVPLVSYADFII